MRSAMRASALLFKVLHRLLPCSAGRSRAWCVATEAEGRPPQGAGARGLGRNAAEADEHPAAALAAAG